MDEKVEYVKNMDGDNKMNNTLTDLNNYLFEAIERLNDDDLNDEEFEKEIRRANAVQSVASTIIQNADVCLKAKKYLDEYGKGDDVKLNMLEMKEK